MQTKPFRSLFKLSSARISQAFLCGIRMGSIDGMKIMQAPTPGNPQFIIALTRTIKGSVTRNLLRRRIKSALRNVLRNHDDTLPSAIFLCVVYAQAANLSFATLESFLGATLWRQNKPLS